jgi:hypothetical protein
MDRCKEHSNKLIFVSKEHAEIFQKLFHPESNTVVYICPFRYQHWHTRDKAKMNKTKKRREIAKGTRNYGHGRKRKHLE